MIQAILDQLRGIGLMTRMTFVDDANGRSLNPKL